MARTIYDIGANNGDDAAYYLAKGFNVVSVEADPALCDKLEERFAAEIADKRMTVERVGLSYGEGELAFHINSFSEWSSFKKGSKATTENEHTTIMVPTISLEMLIRRNPAPYYIKLDIEGMEKPALATLNDTLPLPAYISFEVNQDWITIIDRLTAFGYNAFQIVRQGKGIIPPAPNPSREGAYVPTEFTNSMSGTFGADLPGPWLPRDEVEAAMHAEAEEAKARLARGERRGWHDIHCRRG